MKCKLEIVTGFLGSGKTSFINSYIKTEICKNEKILIILLEKGNTEIDKNIESIYLKDIDELKDTIIKNIEKNNYNKIIIEVNGTILLDKVGDVLKDKDIRKKINLYGNYFLGNSKNIDVYIRNMGEFIIPFIQSSKLIILNNVEEIEEKRKNFLIKEIKNINLTAPILIFDNLESLNKELLYNKYFKYTFMDKIFNTLLRRGKEW